MFLGSRFSRYGGLFKRARVCFKYLGEHFPLMDPDPDPPGGGGGGGGGGGTGDPPADPPEPDPKVKTFTQAQVNSMIADEKRKGEDKTKTAQRETLKELEATKNDKTKSDDQRAQAAERIEALEAALLTAQEKEQREKSKADREHKEALKTAKEESSEWQAKFQSDKIDNAILAAATTHKAYNAQQIVDHVKPLAVLEEVKDNLQKATGKYRAVVHTTVEEEGKEVPKVITVDEYIKELKGKQEWVNLFLPDRKSGTGFTPGTHVQLAGANLSPTDKISAGLRAIQ